MHLWFKLVAILVDQSKALENARSLIGGLDPWVIAALLGLVSGRRVACRARLSGEMLLLSGQPASRALDCRAGWHQRREKLSQRWRLGAPFVLRHHQGRRLPPHRASACGAWSGIRFRTARRARPQRRCQTAHVIAGKNSRDTFCEVFSSLSCSSCSTPPSSPS